MQIPLINEHLFCKYFVCLSVGNATKGFATYGCFHPCFIYQYPNVLYIVYLSPERMYLQYLSITYECNRKNLQH